MTPVALVLLCGLPASGKSTLLKTLLRLWTQCDASMSVNVVSVDALQQNASYCPADWHAAREKAYLLTREALAQGAKGRRLVVVDDTMFYRSMRRRFFLLATEMQSAFLLLYVECPLELCLKRNEARGCPVPREVVQKAAEQLEEPNGLQSYWEKEVHVVDSASVDVRDDGSCRGMAERLVVDWEAAVKLGVSEEEQLQRRKEGAGSNQQAVHRLDLQTRSVVSQTMEQLKMQGNLTELSQYATQINRLRSQYLSNFKSSLNRHQETTTAAVQEALDAFVREIQELFRV